DLATAKGISVRSQPQGVLDKLASGHQGAALAATESPTLDLEKLQAMSSAIVLILDGIEDPQNLGSILRTAWLTGVSAIFVPGDRAVGLTPTACKIASGGAEHVPVETVTNIPSEMARLKELGFWLFGLSEKSERKPWDFKLEGKIAWVL